MTIGRSARIGLAVVAAGLVTSCQTPITEPTPTSIYQESKEGFVLMGAQRHWTGVTKSDSPSLEIRYTKVGIPALYRPSIAFRFTDVMIEKLPVGEYYVYNSYFGGKHLGLPKLMFRILPKQVTYVGDFNVTVKPRLPGMGDFVTKRTLEVVDNRQITLAKFKEKYPEIANAHPVRTEVTRASLRDEF